MRIAGLHLPQRGRTYARPSEVKTCRHLLLPTVQGGFLDSVGGVEWEDSRASYDAAIGAVQTTMSINDAPVPLKHGQWASFAAGSAVMAVVAGRMQSGPDFRFSLGDINGLVGGDTGIGLSNGPMHAAVGRNGSGSCKINACGLADGQSLRLYSIAADNDGADVVVVMHYVPGTDPGYHVAGITRYEIYRLSTEAQATQAVTSDIDPSLSVNLGQYHFTTNANRDAGAFTPDPFLRFAGIAVYGAVYFELASNTIPPDWLIASLWMGLDWRNAGLGIRGHSNRNLYAGCAAWQ